MLAQWAYLSKVVHPGVFALVIQVVGDDDDNLHLRQELRDILGNAEAIHDFCRSSNRSCEIRIVTVKKVGIVHARGGCRADFTWLISV